MVAIPAILSSFLLQAQNNKTFHILKTFNIASGGGWDYIAIGPGNNRLYASHGTQVNILDKTSGDSVGIIENTTGVHGIAFDKSLNRGFTSNGRLNVDRNSGNLRPIARTTHDHLGAFTAPGWFFVNRRD